MFASEFPATDEQRLRATRSIVPWITIIPRTRKNWPVAAADVNVVVQIPYRCLTRTEILKHIVRVAVAVKVAHTHPIPATANARPVSASNKHSPRQIPDRGLARAVLKQIIRMPIAIKIRHTHHKPVGGRKSWPVTAADVNVVAQIPDRCLTRAAIIKHIIRVAIAVKIRHTSQSPTWRKSWPVNVADVNVIVEIPDRRLIRVAILKHIVRVAVAVKVTYRRQVCISRPRDERHCNEKC